jgi:DNA invertase Pin-like site-specific DNA recombinase
MRVAIYARVSTDDKGQDPENQLRQLREWCANAGHTIAQEFIETASGAKGERQRAEFARLMLDAHKRQFDLVLCWALDRFSREGMRPTIGYLQRLADNGVGFHSYTEPLLSTDNEMMRDIVLAVMAALAKQERLRIGERRARQGSRAGHQERQATRPTKTRRQARASGARCAGSGPGHQSGGAAGRHRERDSRRDRGEDAPRTVRTPRGRRQTTKGRLWAAFWLRGSPRWTGTMALGFTRQRAGREAFSFV